MTEVVLGVQAPRSWRRDSGGVGSGSACVTLATVDSILDTRTKSLAD